MYYYKNIIEIKKGKAELSNWPQKQRAVDKYS